MLRIIDMFYSWCVLKMFDLPIHFFSLVFVLSNRQQSFEELKRKKMH